MSERHHISEGFTMGLALVDAVPVLFFCGSAVLIGTRMHSILFWWGAALCIIGGSGKVLWKILLAAIHKDIRILNKQMRFIMPLGFLCMIISVCMHPVSFTMQELLQLPSLLFFAVGLIGMIGMTVLGLTKKSVDVKANWLEQCINCFAQAAFFLGILFFHM